MIEAILSATWAWYVSTLAGPITRSGAEAIMLGRDFGMQRIILGAFRENEAREDAEWRSMVEPGPAS